MCAEVPRALEEECSQWSSRATIRGWIAPVIAITLFIVGTILVSIAMVDLFNALDVRPPLPCPAFTCHLASCAYQHNL